MSGSQHTTKSMKISYWFLIIGAFSLIAGIGLYAVGGDDEAKYDSSISNMQGMLIVDSIVPLRNNLVSTSNEPIVLMVEGEELVVNFSGTFFWTSKGKERPSLKIYEIKDRTLVYNTRKTVSRRNSNTGAIQDYEISVPSKIEFYDKSNVLLEKILVDDNIPEDVKEFNGVLNFDRIDQEVMYDFSVNLKKEKADNIFLFPYIAVDKLGYVSVLYVMNYFSNSCQCIFHSNTRMSVFDQDGKSVFSRDFDDKVIYHNVTSKNGKYLSVSWDKFFGTEQQALGSRGVKIFQIASSQEVYSASLNLSEGYLTRATLQSDEETFVYKIRGGDKGEDFHSSYIIVSPDKKVEYSKDFSRLEWSQLEKIDWKQDFPDNVLKSFNFTKKKLK